MYCIFFPYSGDVDSVGPCHIVHVLDLDVGVKILAILSTTQSYLSSYLFKLIIQALCTTKIAMIIGTIRKHTYII